jgi:methyl-accepting chemotaxis protein
MDEGTQQNAALVEQATAAAQSLNVQAANLTQMMSRFQIGGAGDPVTTPVTRNAPSIGVPSKAAPSKAASPNARTVERRGPNRAFAINRMSATAPHPSRDERSLRASNGVIHVKRT